MNTWVLLATGMLSLVTAQNLTCDGKSDHPYHAIGCRYVSGSWAFFYSYVAVAAPWLEGWALDELSIP